MAPVSGKLTKFLVNDGDAVRAGSLVAEIEVMKILLPLVAPSAGAVRKIASEGAVLSVGDCIARFDSDSMNKMMFGGKEKQSMFDF